MMTFLLGVYLSGFIGTLFIFLLLIGEEKNGWLWSIVIAFTWPVSVPLQFIEISL